MADISVTSNNFITSPTATIIQGTLGEAVTTAGQPLYYDSASGTYKKFDASSTSKDTFAGLACEPGGAGQQILIVTKDPDLQLGGSVTIGDTIWASATGLTKTIGDLTSGWRIYTIGVCTATSGNHVNFEAVRGGIK
jgi:hypothetical protein